MYRILLVDDEPAVRSGMQYLIDWNAFGFQIVGAVENGQEALRFQKETPVDLIITDLKMPVMDGITLIRTLAENREKCKIIIVSAYGEFQYAQAAMSFGVRYYLLKPVNEDVLCGYLSSIAEDLKSEETSKQGESADIHPAVETEQQYMYYQYNMSVNGVVTEMKRYISDHFRESLTLNLLSRVFNFSPIYMGRLFKSETGISFNEYLNNYRVEEAKALIAGGAYLSYEIAEKVGYKDLNYFYKNFKAITGVTPKEYRKQIEKAEE